jgi:hypothetical protein
MRINGPKCLWGGAHWTGTAYARGAVSNSGSAAIPTRLDTKRSKMTILWSRRHWSASPEIHRIHAGYTPDTHRSSFPRGCWCIWRNSFIPSNLQRIAAKTLQRVNYPLQWRHNLLWCSDLCCSSESIGSFRFPIGSLAFTGPPITQNPEAIGVDFAGKSQPSDGARSVRTGLLVEKLDRR